MFEAILLAAITTGVSPTILYSVCKIESNLNPNVIVKNDGGSASYGLCQIKLNTAHHMGYRGTSANLLNPYINAIYAGKFLRYQLARYRGNLTYALVAYNAGRLISNHKYARKVLNETRKQNTTKMSVWAGNEIRQICDV